MNDFNNEEVVGAYYFEGKRTIKESYCAFLDILGFESKIRNAYKNGRSEELLNKIYELLELSNTHLKFGQNVEVYKKNGLTKEETFKISYFTDHLVIGYPKESDGLSELIVRVANHQLIFALNGFFIRGGLADGELFIDNHHLMVYGIALLDAHQLESEIACYPRTILSTKVLNEIPNDHDNDISKYICPSEDGNSFINYLYLLHYCEDIWGQVNLHKSNIEIALNEHQKNYKVFSKYRWLAYYHNWFCKNNSSDPGYEDSYLVSLPFNDGR